MQKTVGWLLILATGFEVSASANDKDSIMSKGDRFPIVEGLGYTNTFNITNIGFAFGFGLQLDAYAGYQTDLYYLNSTADYIVANPVFFVDAAIKSYFELNLILVDYFIYLDLEGFRYTPLDLTFLWNLDQMNEFCYALQWYTQGLTAIVNTALIADECQLGVLGFFVFDQYYQCQQTRYSPTIPFFQYDALQLV